MHGLCYLLLIAIPQRFVEISTTCSEIIHVITPPLACLPMNKRLLKWWFSGCPISSIDLIRLPSNMVLIAWLKRASVLYFIA